MQNKYTFRQGIRFIGKYLKATKKKLILAIVLSLLSTICSTISPIFIAAITNEIQKAPDGNMDMNTIYIYSALMVSMYLLSFVFNMIQQSIMIQINQELAFKIRSDANKKINKINLYYFDKQSYGNSMSILTTDIWNVTFNLAHLLSDLLTSIFRIVTLIIVMCILQWLLCIIVIGFSAISFGIIIILIRYSRKKSKISADTAGIVNGQINEMVNALSIINSFNAQEKINTKFFEQNARLATNSSRSGFITSTIQPVMDFVNRLCFFIVCLVGCLLIGLGYKGLFGFGLIPAFVACVMLIQVPLNTFSTTISNYPMLISSCERVNRLFDEPDVIDKNNKLQQGYGNKLVNNIELSHVCFSYDTNKPIIDDFNLKIKSGEKVAIVGETGAGKSTIMNLLMRFYEMTSGDILINNKSIKSTSRAELRNRFCVVLQEPWTFNGTIEENLIFTTKDVTHKKVVEICKKIGIHDFIMSLDKGYQTIINNESNISSGQRQLLTIARALIEDNGILILDEATSNIDTKFERQIQKAIDILMKNRTSIIIAHRLSTIKMVDNIVVLDHGKIVEQGTHNQLLKARGFYYDLYNSQFS